MNKRLLLIFFVLSQSATYAQKPNIDSAVFGKWPTLNYPALSNDGRYALYTIENSPIGGSTLVIQAVHGTWKLTIPGVASYQVGVTHDSRKAVFKLPGDSLEIVTLGDSSVEYIPKVLSFRVPQKCPDEWLAYTVKGVKNRLVLRNLITGKSVSFDRIKDFVFSEQGNTLVFQQEEEKGGVFLDALKYFNTVSGSLVTTWQGDSAAAIVFDTSNSRVAFMGGSKLAGESRPKIWYYRLGADSAECLTRQQSLPDGDKLHLDWNAISGFSNDGSRVFFNLTEVAGKKAGTEAVKLDVWSFTDAKLQSEQLKELGPRNYTCSIDVSTRQVKRLEDENDIEQSPFPAMDGRNDDFLLLLHVEGSGSEWNWNPKSRPTMYLVSTRTGTRRTLNEPGDGKEASSFELSAGGKYVIYYDSRHKDYFIYDIASGLVHNITRGMAATWTILENDMPGSPYQNIPVAGWGRGDSSVYVYDQSDIWRLDPAGRRPPDNMTGGYGRRNHIIFRLTNQDVSGGQVGGRAQLILSAFNTNTKENGFYAVKIDAKGNPERLSMGPYIYCAPANSALPDNEPVKAQDAETYLVKRESANAFPNYFFTTDFRSFQRVTDLSPEKQYNWISSELLSWRSPDGSTLSGILYKPENFDPGKKYPVIFYYYDKLSDELNMYRLPEASEGFINVPYFVSNGYLVLMPDIKYVIGEPGRSVTNTVVSAARFLSGKPWVNKQKLGLDGQSFGAYETDYIITHSHLFAAACSTSGFSDLISAYGALWREGSSCAEYAELRNLRIGAPLGLRPDLYLANSPIVRAAFITTPLLMMNNKQDEGVPFAQGVEFFTTLRRLGKKAWMLQYDKGAHEVFGPDAVDLTTRQRQFFDHYLKDAPEPLWMRSGIPARAKGLTDGLSY